MFKFKEMKSFFTKIISLVSIFLFPILSYGQAQITTKKMKLEDFPEKITKVVLPGNIFLDGAIKEEVNDRWKISPYEFCSMEEFEEIKTSSDYYFLLTVTGKFKRESEPGLQMLTLVKGGENAKNGIDKMLDVVTLPICSTEYPSGREFTFLPAFIDIIQAHVLASMAKEINAYTGLSNYSLNLANASDLRVIFSKDDINGDVTEAQLENLIVPGMTIAEEENVDELMDNSSPNTLVSYVAAPYDAKPGSYCYKMLIDCSTHKLYYFRRHRITQKTKSGFLAEDLKRIAER